VEQKLLIALLLSLIFSEATMSQAVSEAFWASFRGAGLFTAGGIAAMAEAGSLAVLKVVNSIETEETVLKQLSTITTLALAAIALGSALIVSAAASITGGYLLAGAAGLLMTADMAEKFYLVASLAIAAYTFYLHYNAFHWAFTPYTLE
jgi:hypothetical protein